MGRLGAFSCIAAVIFFFPAAVRAADWERVDCSKSEVTIPGTSECWHGPVNPGQSGGCYFENYATYRRAESPPIMGVLSVVNHRSQCYVQVTPHDEQLLKTAAPITQKGGNWSPVHDFLSGYVASFVSDGWGCAAFVQVGGHDYMFRGYYCAGKGKSVSDAELADAIKSVHISQ